MSEEPTQEEKTKYTTYFIVGTIIVLIAFLGYTFFVYKPAPIETETVEYSYFTFTYVQGLWQTSIQLDKQVYDAVFRFNPKQVEDVYITGQLGNFTQPVYITFDPVQDKEAYKYLALASSELSLHLIRALEKEVISACTSNETAACQDRPIVTCEKGKNVIYLNPLPPTQINLNNTCITLQGHEMELLKSVDRLLYQWYKIMR
ncbi:MAG TPA: hypothetical protein VI612_05695 [Candidatus Nanoarchaeia archaeon]|nr:hypothetical protein [Candidatus Nanoarchaeia archaeon]